MADINCHRRVLAVSRATRDWHLKQGLDADRVHVMHNGVDLDRFRPRRPTGYVHEEMGLRRVAPLLATIGQIGVRKGMDLFCSAAQQVASRRPDAHFMVVGQRYSEKAEAVEFHQMLELSAKAQPLAGRFHFLGMRGDVEQLLNELTVLVHAARQEPLGRVLLEAAASGTPVVATRVGGTPEIFPDEAKAARVIPSEDVDALANAMHRLLDDERERTRMASAARRRAEEAFDVTNAAEALLEHYGRVLL
jgi:glycosyltransferase involved in cell wall biosynthesis